jgi:hypothetical protein
MSAPKRRGGDLHKDNAGNIIGEDFEEGESEKVFFYGCAFVNILS